MKSLQPILLDVLNLNWTNYLTFCFAFPYINTNTNTNLATLFKRLVKKFDEIIARSAKLLLIVSTNLYGLSSVPNFPTILSYGRRGIVLSAFPPKYMV